MRGGSCHSSAMSDGRRMTTRRRTVYASIKTYASDRDLLVPLLLAQPALEQQANGLWYERLLGAGTGRAGAPGDTVGGGRSRGGEAIKLSALCHQRAGIGERSEKRVKTSAR